MYWTTARDLFAFNLSDVASVWSRTNHRTAERKRPFRASVVFCYPSVTHAKRFRRVFEYRIVPSLVCE